VFDLGLLLVLVATVAPALLLAPRAAARAGLPAEVGSDAVWWAGLGFVLVGRGVWLALNPGALGYPIDVIRLTQGMVVPAGVVGAVVGGALLVRRRDLGGGAGRGLGGLIGPVVVAGLAAIAGWHATCEVAGRCSGGAPPLVIAVLAAGLVWWVWSPLPAPSSAGRALVAIGVVLVAVAVGAAFRPRLASWPTVSDGALIAEGVLVLALAGRWRGAGRAER
jgi:hypothetical protein